MDRRELKQLTAAAIKMATAANLETLYKGKEINPEIIGPVAAVLLQEALNNSGIGEALLETDE